MTKLTIVAHIKVKDNKVDFVRNELLKLIDITRNEKGCINYDLHQDNMNAAHFMFYENWESWEDWQKHRYNSHMKNFREVTKNAVEEFLVNEMTQIE